LESATVRRPPPLPGLIQLGLIGLLLVLAVVAWKLTDVQMGGMDAGPGTDLGSLGFFIGAWVVMMAAMMFPSIAPMVLMFARMQEGRRERGQAVPAGLTTLFVGGYLVSWTTAGLVGYGLFELGASISGDAFSWDNGGPYLAGGIIVAAALYQLTPLKDVCLRHCRSPLFFLLSHSRPGRAGALRMGIEHGGFCVGCCWMLMAALFALGVMSLGWMAFIASLIAIEKLLPWRLVANRSISLLLLVLGLAVAITPENVPGLTLPDSPAAMRAMESMGMEPRMTPKRESGGGMNSGGMKPDHMGSGGMKSDHMRSGDMR
jgi:predicted metal-binding membrane protein